MIKNWLKWLYKQYKSSVISRDEARPSKTRQARINRRKREWREPISISISSSIISISLSVCEMWCFPKKEVIIEKHLQWFYLVIYIFDVTSKQNIFYRQGGYWKSGSSKKNFQIYYQERQLRIIIGRWFRFYYLCCSITETYNFSWTSSYKLDIDKFECMNMEKNLSWEKREKAWWQIR